MELPPATIILVISSKHDFRTATTDGLQSSFHSSNSILDGCLQAAKHSDFLNYRNTCQVFSAGFLTSIFSTEIHVQSSMEVSSGPGAE
jgi:hypothetical protein